MAEIINLRQKRKEAARAAARQQADANAARFGRTKGRKSAEQAEKARSDALLDGARREPGPGD
jgi:hypothetical protein